MAPVCPEMRVSLAIGLIVAPTWLSSLISMQAECLLYSDRSIHYAYRGKCHFESAIVLGLDEIKLGLVPFHLHQCKFCPISNTLLTTSLLQASTALSQVLLEEYTVSSCIIESKPSLVFLAHWVLQDKISFMLTFPVCEERTLAAIGNLKSYNSSGSLSLLHILTKSSLQIAITNSVAINMLHFQARLKSLDSEAVFTV